uniref:Uncharacterized protein n=1 Tax=Anguilla anguilla TaxID=7936 RepID=A0A0E9Q249_ANGAN
MGTLRGTSALTINMLG